MPDTQQLPEVGWLPSSGMLVRRMDDGSVCVVDAIGRVDETALAEAVWIVDRESVCADCDQPHQPRCAAHHPQHWFTCILPPHRGNHFDPWGGHWNACGQIVEQIGGLLDA